MQTQTGAAELNFSELIDEIKHLISGCWRFRWQAISLAWIICVASWSFIFTLPDVYQASTRLYIDTHGSLRPLLQGLAVNSNLLDEVEVMVKTITSRPSLEKIAAQSGMDMQVQDSAGMDTLVKRLREDISINLGRNQMLEISFEEPDPRMAKSVVAILIDVFVEGLLGTNRSDTESAQEFIEEKLEEYERFLSAAETRLAAFKKRNVGQMPGEQGGYYQRLQSEMEKLASLESRLKLATQRRDGLQSQMVGETPVFGLMTSGEQTMAIDSRQIMELEAQLIELSLQYTDSHPDIIRIKALLESLRADLAKQRSGRISPDVAPLDMNPVYQEMKIQFSQAELEAAYLSTEWNDQKQLVDKLRKKIDTLPEIEAELTRLNRNYDVNKAQYDALLRRLETARLSEDAEESRSSIKFRIIDPPTVASSPVGPDRLLLVTLALVAGIAAGAALAIFRGFAEPVFCSSKKLERQYGVPVLGAIMWRRSPAERWQARKRVGIFSVCVLGLIVCYLAVVFFDQSGVLLAGLSGPMTG